ncbi:MAG: leucine-rich repeat domain-containing protein [Clostridia bacterium]|nr:leucine-rich repeat domain-containing protein [Clostridia bacterium]
MKMTTKLLLLSLALLTCLAVLSSCQGSQGDPSGTTAEPTAPDGGASTPEYDMQFTLKEDGTYELTRCTGTIGVIEVPAEYQGKPVTSIAFGALEGYKGLKELTVPFVGSDVDGVGGVHFGYIFGARTYSQNSTSVPTSLKRVNVTGGERVGYSAFYGCIALETVILPEGITGIGRNAFYGCSAIRYTFYESGRYLGSAQNPYAVFMGTFSEQFERFKLHEDTRVIAPGAFENQEKLFDITLNEGIISIGDCAFRNCEALTEIVLPGSVRFLGSDIFSGCFSLESVTLPSTLDAVGEYMFYECAGLSTVTLPASAVSIGEHAFHGCTLLEEISLPDGIEVIGASAFEGCVALTDITFSATLSTVEDSAFVGCTALTQISLPASLKSIGGFAFQNCTALTSVSFSEGLESIGESAFIGCKSLRSISLPDTVTVLGASAFSGCSALHSVKLSATLPKIDETTFYECTGITSIEIPASVTEIGEKAFYCCYKLIEVRNHSALELKAGEMANGYASFYAKDVHQEDSKLVLAEGYLFYMADEVTYLLGYVGDATELILPATSPTGGTYKIYQYAFYHDASIESVTLPAGVSEIGDYAFHSCTALKKVTLPQEISKLGGFSFFGCKALTEIVYQDTVANWNKVTKGMGWNISAGAYVVTCTDGTAKK